jgi:hypothetical protein
VSQAADRDQRAAASGAHSKPAINTRRLTAALAAVGTLIGVLAAATSLFDWFGGKVDPPPPPPPAEIDARVLRVDLRSTSQRLVDYLRETNQPTAGLSKFEGAEPGYVFNVRVRLQGNQDKRLPLRWSIIDASTGQPLRDPLYTQTATVFEPGGPSHARTWPIWVPFPSREGKFRVRATLIDEKRQPLDEAESEPFVLARAPAP